MNTYITSFSPNPGEDPDPTEVVEEESDSDSIDSEDSDYIDDYLYINDEENIINDLNEKIKEGIANKAIVVDFINERYIPLLFIIQVGWELIPNNMMIMKNSICYDFEIYFDYIIVKASYITVISMWIRMLIGLLMFGID